MILTEENVIQMVKEAVMNLMELDMGTIGGAGSLSEADLIDPSERFANELAMCRQIKAKQEQNPRYRVNLEKVFGETELYKIWKNYYNAMMSRPGKKANGFFSFVKFVCISKMGQKLRGFECNGNFLFGFWFNNVFISAYFAPSSKIGMFQVIKAICQYNNVVFPVTQDLSSMLERLGIPKASETHSAKWRGKVVDKDVFGTSEHAMSVGLAALDLMMMFSK